MNNKIPHFEQQFLVGAERLAEFGDPTQAPSELAQAEPVWRQPGALEEPEGRRPEDRKS